LPLSRIGSLEEGVDTEWQDLAGFAPRPEETPVPLALLPRTLEAAYQAEKRVFEGRAVNMAKAVGLTFSSDEVPAAVYLAMEAIKSRVELKGHSVFPSGLPRLLTSEVGREVARSRRASRPKELPTDLLEAEARNETPSRVLAGSGTAGVEEDVVEREYLAVAAGLVQSVGRQLHGALAREDLRLTARQYLALWRSHLAPSRERSLNREEHAGAPASDRAAAMRARRAIWAVVGPFLGEAATALDEQVAPLNDRVVHRLDHVLAAVGFFRPEFLKGTPLARTVALALAWEDEEPQQCPRRHTPPSSACEVFSTCAGCGAAFTVEVDARGRVLPDRQVRRTAGTPTHTGCGGVLLGWRL
jgi:hypothetical protein